MEAMLKEYKIASVFSLRKAMEPVIKQTIKTNLNDQTASNCESRNNKSSSKSKTISPLEAVLKLSVCSCELEIMDREVLEAVVVAGQGGGMLNLSLVSSRLSCKSLIRKMILVV